MDEYLKNNEKSTRLLFLLNKSCLTSFTTIPSIREVSWEQYYRQLNILLRSFSTKTLRISNFVKCQVILSLTVKGKKDRAKSVHEARYSKMQIMTLKGTTRGTF